MVGATTIGPSLRRFGIQPPRTGHHSLLDRRTAFAGGAPGRDSARRGVKPAVAAPPGLPRETPAMTREDRLARKPCR